MHCLESLPRQQHNGLPLYSTLMLGLAVLGVFRIRAGEEDC